MKTSKQVKGTTGENLTVLGEIINQRILIRTGIGSDFESKPNPATPRDPITSKVAESTYLVEVKTGKSKLTNKQQETRDANPKHYKVRRPPI